MSGTNYSRQNKGLCNQNQTNNCRTNKCELLEVVLKTLKIWDILPNIGYFLNARSALSYDGLDLLLAYICHDFS